MLKSAIDQDLKAAMLAGDKRRVEVLRGLKSAILYKEVADNKRDQGLNDEEVIAVLKKEQKSRKDAIALYEQAGESARASEENYQIEIIKEYLPAELSEQEVNALIDKVMTAMSLDTITPQIMGSLIGAVKQRVPTVDGALVAKLIKQRLDN